MVALLLAWTAGAQTPIRCCDRPDVQRAVTSVAAVAEALADPEADARAALAHLATLRPPDDLPEVERDAFAGLRRAARATATRSDGPSYVLPYLTRQAVFLALRHEGGDVVIAEGWCAEHGGWIQRGVETLRRPWKGCGRWR